MYRCKICGKEFKTKCGYVRHELAHTVTFKCETCGKQYRRRADLKRHQKITLHNDEGRSSTFTCSTCGRVFSSSRELIIHAYTHRPQIGGQSRSAINGAAEVKTLRPIGEDKYDLVKFLSGVRPVTEEYLLSKVRRRAIKWYIVAQVELTRENREGEMQTVQPFFRSVTYSLLTADTFEIHDLNEALQKLVIGLEKYIHESRLDPSYSD